MEATENIGAPPFHFVVPLANIFLRPTFFTHTEIMDFLDER